MYFFDAENSKVFGGIAGIANSLNDKDMGHGEGVLAHGSR